MPWALYTDPEVASCGKLEKELQSEGLLYDKEQFSFEHVDRAITDEETDGFLQVFVKKGSDKILGVLILHARASEMLPEFVLAMKHGLGLNSILGTIHVYPTLSEASKLLAGSWRKKKTSPKTLKILEKFHTWRRS